MGEEGTHFLSRHDVVKNPPKSAQQHEAANVVAKNAHDARIKSDNKTIARIQRRVPENSGFPASPWRRKPPVSIAATYSAIPVTDQTNTPTDLPLRGISPIGSAVIRSLTRS